MCVCIRRGSPHSKQEMIVKCTTSRSPQTVFLYRTFLCYLLGTVTNSALNAPVNGILRGSIFLSVNVSLAKRVAKTEWDFQPKNGLVFQFAEFQNGKLERANISDRFGQRIEMASETTLRIKDLEMGDSGEYKARVRFSTAEYQDHTFILTVYEPVPTPQIHHKVVSNTPDECNGTLQCQASGKGLNLSWKRGNPLRALEEDGLDRIQLSANSTSLHFSWQPSFSNISFFCLISNPADQKNVSVDLLNICKNEEQNPGRRMWLWYPAPIAIIIAAAVLGIWIWKKRRKTSNKRGDVSTVPKERLPDPQYSEILKSRSAPEGNEDQEPNAFSDQNATMNAPTVYAELQLPAHLSDRIT